MRKSLRSLNSNSDAFEVTPAYRKAPIISLDKKKHLMEMCAENSIKPVYWLFYENLATANDSNSETKFEVQEI